MYHNSPPSKLHSGKAGRRPIFPCKPNKKLGTDTNVCPLETPGGLSPNVPGLPGNWQPYLLRTYAAPIARRCWKHSRQNTGRPCVGRKGTVVSFPHCEQLVLVSDRICAPPPPPSARFALQPLHRFGSFLNPLSAKNICSPAVNTNSAPHSEHFRTLSWYSMEAFPLRPQFGKGTRRTLHERLERTAKRVLRRTGLGSWACERVSAT